MSPSRLARFLLSNVALYTLWLLLSSCLVSASSRALTPVLTPPNEWDTNMGVSISSGSTATATISFSTVNEDWNTLSITAYGRTADGRFASWTLQVDGSITTYTSANQSPVQIPIEGNHGYSVVLSPGPDAYGLMIIAIMVSGSSIPAAGATTSAAVVATPSTTRMQEPLMTSSPTAIATTTMSLVAGVNTTFTSGGTVLILTDSISSSPTSTPASLLTLDDPLLHAPSNSVSLTNSSPSFNASNANFAASSGQPNYSTIVGAVFGSLAAVAVCFLVAFMLYRRRQRKRIPPSTAFMNYRSTTEQPPQYYFHKDRTPFKEVLTIPRNNRAGIGAGGGFLTVKNRGRALSPLDEKSAEGSMNTHSPSPYPGMSANDNGTLGSAAGAAASNAVAGGDRYPSLDSSIDAGIARTISPPSSAEPTAQTFQLAPAITRSERNSNAYDGMEEDMAHMPNPFDDHPSSSPGRRDGEYGFGRAV